MKIFAATTGRSGTVFLVEMFKILTDIPSFHESVPYCIGQTNYEVNNNCISGDTQYILDEKVRRIRQSLSHEGCYFEANNMFIKSFVWTVMDNFEDVYCIYLHRNPMDVFFSFGARNWRRGYDWLLKSDWKRNVLKPGTLTYYENLMWMWYEVKARFEYFKPRFQKTWDFNFKDINDIEEYYKMFDHFGVLHKKIDSIPDDLKKNSGKNSTSRFNELGDLYRRNWEHEGVEWAYSPDILEIAAGK